jgi:hypothetical protein
MFHQEIVTDALTGARFNDYEKMDATPMGLEIKDEVPEYSTQVCALHVKQLNMQDGLDRGVGTGNCGVVGCEREAEHFYYFRVPKGVALEGELYREEPTAPAQVAPAPVTRTTTRRKKAVVAEPEAGITGLA